MLGISLSRLADRLDRLVDAGILRREPYKDNRTRLEYRLTQKGHELHPVLMALRDWGDAHMADGGPPVHYLHSTDAAAVSPRRALRVRPMRASR